MPRFPLPIDSCNTSRRNAPSAGAAGPVSGRSHTVYTSGDREGALSRADHALRDTPASHRGSQYGGDSDTIQPRCRNDGAFRQHGGRRSGATNVVSVAAMTRKTNVAQRHHRRRRDPFFSHLRGAVFDDGRRPTKDDAAPISVAQSAQEREHNRPELVQLSHVQTHTQRTAGRPAVIEAGRGGQTAYLSKG